MRGHLALRRLLHLVGPRERHRLVHRTFFARSVTADGERQFIAAQYRLWTISMQGGDQMHGENVSRRSALRNILGRVSARQLLGQDHDQRHPGRERARLL